MSTPMPLPSIPSSRHSLVSSYFVSRPVKSCGSNSNSDADADNSLDRMNLLSESLAELENSLGVKTTEIRGSKTRKQQENSDSATSAAAASALALSAADSNSNLAIENSKFPSILASLIPPVNSSSDGDLLQLLQLIRTEKPEFLTTAAINSESQIILPSPNHLTQPGSLIEILVDEENDEETATNFSNRNSARNKFQIDAKLSNNANAPESVANEHFDEPVEFLSDCDETESQFDTENKENPTNEESSTNPSEVAARSHAPVPGVRTDRTRVFHELNPSVPLTVDAMRNNYLSTDEQWNKILGFDGWETENQANKLPGMAENEENGEFPIISDEQNYDSEEHKDEDEADDTQPRQQNHLLRQQETLVESISNEEWMNEPDEPDELDDIEIDRGKEMKAIDEANNSVD